MRLKNGFPTTEREAKEFEDRQKADEAAREQYVRNLVKVHARAQQQLPAELASI